MISMVKVKLEYYSAKATAWLSWGKFDNWSDALRELRKCKTQGYLNRFRITEVKNEKF